MNIRENVSLRNYNTFGVDVIARYLVEIEDDGDYDLLFSSRVIQDVEKLILGGGSNLLFTRDYDGVVIHLNTSGIEVYHENNEEVFLKVASGVDWDDLINYCIENNYGGLENLSMIPGKVGASPIQNIGAYGMEMEEHFVKLDCIILETGEKINIPKHDCFLGYRDSIFKREFKGKCLITNVYFVLDKYPVINLTYQALQDELKYKSLADITVKDVSDAVRAIRSRKLPDPKKLGNAGSFFKNPVVTEEYFETLRKKFPDIVGFALKDGNVKLAAGWLIDRCGLKGFRSGDVGVHKDQALVIVNYGTASGREILEFSEKLVLEVQKMFGVTLEREVTVI